jgi:hypothetical protein
MKKLGIGTRGVASRVSQHRVRKGHREEKALFCAKRDAIKGTSIRITVLEVLEKFG